MSTQQRKSDHIKICLEENVETPSARFEDVTLIPKLPEMDFGEIDTSIIFLGKKLKLPLIIAGMTGGTEEAEKINKELAKVAEKKKIGFGLGSQRAMIEKQELKKTYYVRDVAPKTLVLGNIGITKLKKYSAKQIEKMLKNVGADALCVHINAAQELFQREGELDFSSCAFALKKLCNELPYPVIAKEVGSGFSREMAISFIGTGIKAIDVGGYGGTNWVVVDGLRANIDVGDFRKWGIPTACSILEVKKAGLQIIATGGVRTGLDMAKAIALGADICGIALPFLRILEKEGADSVEKYIDNLERQLKSAMFLTGSKNIGQLKKADYVASGFLKNWIEERKIK